MQEGCDRTWYQFNEQDEAWFEDWTKRLRDAYRTFFSNQNDEKMTRCFEIQLPRIIQAAGIRPAKGMLKRDSSDFLLKKQGETDDKKVIARRRKVLKTRGITRDKARKELEKLASEMDSWNVMTFAHEERGRFVEKVSKLYEQFEKGFLQYRDYSGMLHNDIQVLIWKYKC